MHRRRFLAAGRWQHPARATLTLALAAARAVLLHLKEHGSELQRGLNLRTTKFVETLRKSAEAVGAPVQINHFSSWFCINFPPDVPLSGIFFAGMRSKGVHIWEGRPCFLTLAHTDADLELVVNAFENTIAEMQLATFLPERIVDARPVTPPSGARKGRDAAGNAAWFVPDPSRPGKYLQIKDPVSEHG